MLRPRLIFLSYRRNDSRNITRKIYDRLAEEFEKETIFRDLDSIPGGETFKEYIERELNQCQILIAVIGPTWLKAKDKDGNSRLDNPKDWVRLEIEFALKRGIRVIPLLINDTKMPQADELPDPLKALSDRHALRMRHFFRQLKHRDVNRLIEDIKESIGEERNETPSEFSFEVVTVNEQGQIHSRQKKTAKYIREDLGNGVSLDMVMIPGGQFQMGSSAGYGYDDEHPQHLVTVKSFWMGKYPVTQAQWEAVTGFPKIERELKPYPSRFKGGNLPVEQITWYDAIEFCKRLAQKTGRKYRLPSEAEWEYACRAGTTTSFHFGEAIPRQFVNCKRNFGLALIGRFAGETNEVGCFKAANAFGLADMHGNVWEWCFDHWHENYQDAPTDGSPWNTGGDNSCQLLRGGSWFNSPNNCRSALRLKQNPGRRRHNVGLRVVNV